MNAIDELIAKAADGALSQSEQHQIDAACAKDPSLAATITIEQRITSVLKADAASLETTPSDNTPGAPLLQYMASSKTVSMQRKARLYYYGAAVCILLGIAAYMVSHSNTALPPAEHPVLQPIVPNPAPQVSEPAVIAPANKIDAEVRTAIKKDSVKRKPAPPVIHRPKDLDNELSPPPVFTDPKGHMPINK